MTAPGTDPVPAFDFCVLQTGSLPLHPDGIADTIIPGHGRPIPVTADLVRHLLATFADAELSWSCPEVTKQLQQRLLTLEHSDRG